MCKILRFLLMVLPILLSACGTSKKVVNGKLDAKLLTAEQVVAAVEKNVISDECLTAKMNFRFKSGSQNLSVGGNLKMKRNDVIQLSLVALGLMEAVRIEFTPEDALVIDRINKRYIKAAYSEFHFFKEAGIDFSFLESLFRNEIFLPTGQSGLSLEYTTSGNATVVCQNSSLKFKFLTSLATSLVQQTQISSAKGGSAEFDWSYADFSSYNGKSFPLSHKINLVGMGRDAEVQIQLRNLSNESGWETRTKVRSSYQEMKAEDFLRMLHL